MAREVGVEGKLGGQANVPGAAGTWKDLTDNVNQLAANLTDQVRAIAEVATAVTQGDLTRSITVEAQGEVAALKDTINEMIRNLTRHDRKNTEQDWLRPTWPSSAACCRASATWQRRPDLILSELAPLVGAQHGAFYLLERRRRPTSRRLTLPRATRYQARRHDGKRVRARRRPGRPVRAREAARSCSTTSPPRLHRDQLRPGRGRAAATSSSCRCSSRGRCKA